MPTNDDDVWMDGDAGPLIRPYTVNGGRTHPVVDLDLLSLVLTVGQADANTADREHVQVLELCRQPISVAEVAAHMRLPVTVTKVLLADLVECGAMTTRVSSSPSSATNILLLEQLLDGLQRI
ncbi:DUF742 domain-containing protein [Actinomadura sp. KC345]|nr:DUF742 domain-containing protein [Actinomadura sp. KC345]